MIRIGNNNKRARRLGYDAHEKPEPHCEGDVAPQGIEPPDDLTEAEKVDNSLFILSLLHLGQLTSSASFVTSSSNLLSHSLH